MGALKRNSPDANLAIMERGALTLAAIIRVDRSSRVSDLDRFAALGMPSFERCFAPGTVQEFVVIVPARDVRVTRRRLSHASAHPVRVIAEEDLLGAAVGSVDGGWMKQQLLKLAVTEVVDTEWCLVTDADVVATRPMTREFLLPEGRALWQREPAGAHLTWWRASSSLLKSPHRFSPDELAFGVTPAILHAPSLRGLHQRVEALYPGAHWARTLADCADEVPWTEYTLYWTHIVDSGLTDLYSTSDTRMYALDASVWVEAQIAERATAAALTRAFDPDAAHGFFVYRSNLGQPLLDTVRLLRPFVDPGRAIAPTERARWATHSMSSRIRNSVGSVRWHLHRTSGAIRERLNAQ